MKLEQDRIVLSETSVLCSDVGEDVTALSAKFIICSFDVNRNGVKLNRATIDDWLYTLVSQPVVAKIGVSDSGEADFTSHNMHIVTRQNEKGELYANTEFDSAACGVFTSVQVEVIDGKEFITATAKLWKRFPEFCAIVKKRLLNGALNTSWEIAIEKSHIELSGGKQVKVIDAGKFLGHSLLASYLPSAYPDSQLLEVASENTDHELIEALSKDITEISNITKQKEDKNLENSSVISTVPTPVEVVSVTETNTAMLTEFDLRKALREAISDKIGKEKWDFYILYHFPTDRVVWIQMWDAQSELDIITFTYSVDNDIVTMSEPTEAKLTVSVAEINSTIAGYEEKVSEQTNALVTANETIHGLNDKISELAAYKDKFEQVEQEKIASELIEKQANLKSYAVKSGLISEAELAENDELKACISSLDEQKIKAIIADRFVATQTSNATIEVSTTTTSPALANTIQTNLANEEVLPDHRAFMRQFLGR